MGTCKMGHDDMAVVDSRLRVRGNTNAVGLEAGFVFLDTVDTGKGLQRRNGMAACPGSCIGFLGLIRG